jgi:nucleoside-diphosphate-sugar epimerase
MNILVTGITGLFGSHLAREFGQLGVIHGLKRETSDLKLVDDLAIHWHKGELSDMESLLESLREIDLVIHAAGLVSFASKDKEKLYEVNTSGTANLVNAMLASGVKKLVHVSSVAAIGRSAEQMDIDEEFIWTESPLNTEYAVSKYWAELEAWRGEQEGLELIVINPSVLLGKASYGKSSAAIYSFVLEGNTFFPKGNVNYLDVRDAAKITRLLVEKGVWGERFILNKESLPYQTFFKEIASVFNKKAPSIPLPNWLISLGTISISILRLLGLTKSPLNRQTAMLAQQKTRFLNSKVQHHLAYEYYSLRESLEWAKKP